MIIMYLLTIWKDQITVKSGRYDHHIQMQISLKLVSIKWSISKWDMTDGLREWNVIDHLSSSCFWFGCKIAVIEQLDENYNKFSSFSFPRCLTKATPLMNSPYSCEKFNISEAVDYFFFLSSKPTISFPSFNMTTNSCVLPRETAAKKPMVNKLNLTSKCKGDLKNLTRKSGLKNFLTIITSFGLFCTSMENFCDNSWGRLTQRRARLRERAVTPSRYQDLAATGWQNKQRQLHFWFQQ